MAVKPKTKMPKFERTPVSEDSFESAFQRQAATRNVDDALRAIERTKQERRKRTLQIADPPAPQPRRK